MSAPENLCFAQLAFPFAHCLKTFETAQALRTFWSGFPEFPHSSLSLFLNMRCLAEASHHLLKILFDQGTPVPLRKHLEHQVSTAYEQQWDALSNGDLLTAAESEGFDVLVTTDQNLQYQ